MRKLVNPKNNQVIESPFTDVEVVDMIRAITVRDSKLRSNMSFRDAEFCESLYVEWRKRGLTETQRWWAHKLVIDATKANFETSDSEREPPKAVAGGFTKLAELFVNAKTSGLKSPKVRFNLPQLGELRLSMAGVKSKFPGSINVTAPASAENGVSVWFGRVTTNGQYVGSGRANPEHTKIVRAFLNVFSRDPVSVASWYGRQTGRCCFCAIELTDERSLLVGFGPVCARKFSLWYPHSKSDIVKDRSIPDVPFDQLIKDELASL